MYWNNSFYSVLFYYSLPKVHILVFLFTAIYIMKQKNQKDEIGKPDLTNSIYRIINTIKANNFYSYYNMPSMFW